MQPKKHMRIGGNDLYVLDNNLLRDYVTAVYDEYRIEDPLAQSMDPPSLPQKEKNNTSFGVKFYQTPEKPVTNYNGSITQSSSKLGHRATRTT